jgi:SAM-dependent methyltransferase
MLDASNLRRFARRIPMLYWAAGLVRYASFQWHVWGENRRYKHRNAGSLPPPLMRYRVHGALDESSYCETGRIVAGTISSMLRKHGIRSGARILDFACGPGRIAVEVKRSEPGWILVGSDTDPEAIAWAKTALRDIGEFHTNEGTPPTSFASGSFDAVYAVSLFTHLAERAQEEWLGELARVLKPGGIVLATVHGRSAGASCTAEEKQQLKDHGFVYRVDRKGKLKLDGLPDTYQTTFHTREYVERKWSTWFVVEDYCEGGLGGHQDLIVLRKVG